MTTEDMNMNFKQKLSNFIINAKSQREDLQELIVMALEHFEKTADCVYLTMLMDRTVAVKSIPTVTIKDYIKEHAPVRYVANKEKKHVFTVDKDSKVELNASPTVTWYDWKKAKHNNVKEVDHAKLAIKHLKHVNDGTHSLKYMANVLIEAGFTTDQLLNMVDSLSLKQVA